MIKKIWHKFSQGGEKGQALVLVLILLIVGALVIAPLMANIGTGLKAGEVHEEKANELYAADAGIEDGLWQVKNDKLATKFPTYKPYDYYESSGDNWTYALAEMVNSQNVNVTIKNMWMPMSLAVPTAASANITIKGTAGNPPKLIITGTVVNSPTGSTPGSYKIKIDYYDTQSLLISTLGIWLPPGFTYVAGSSELDNTSLPHPAYYSVPNTPPYKSGYAVVWTFSNYPFAGTTGPSAKPAFPGVNPTDSPMESIITFQFNGPIGGKPAAVAWINTNLDLGGGIFYTWDGDKKVYQITSTAGNTTIDAYAIKSELREMASAIGGDYYATGNSLMRNAYDDWGHVRETWLSSTDHSSSALVNAIPSDSEVAYAYLYWTAWRSEESKTIPFGPDTYSSYDTCSNFDNWNITTPSSWAVFSNYFRGHYSAGGDPERTFTLKDSLNLAPYALTPGGPATLTVSFDQWVAGSGPWTGDGLSYAFSTDGGLNWTANNPITLYTSTSQPSSINRRSITIPTNCLVSQFKIRFYLAGFSGSGKYCKIDNIRIASNKSAMPADTSIVFKIDDGAGFKQVWFDAAGNSHREGEPGLPQPIELTADRSPVIQNITSGESDGFSYACFKDVTALVRQYTAPHDNPSPTPDNHPGNASYMVGGVDGTLGIDYGESGYETEYQLAHAGWSLIIIYNSPVTQGDEVHQLYLYDRFTYADDDVSSNPMRGDLDFDGDSKPGGDIGGFLVPEPIAGEEATGNVAKMTVFVGEGDNWITGDFVAFNSPQKYWDADMTHDRPSGIPDNYKLWDGIGSPPAQSNTQGSPNNVWNGMSTLFPADGVDIDTFYILWSRHMLSPGDSSAHIDLYTHEDNWNLIYVIISFRSKTTTGGTVTYRIR